MKINHYPWLTLLIAAVSATTVGADWSSDARLDLAGRYFFEEPRWPGQDDQRLQPSLAGSAEWRWRGDAERVSIIPYLRYDPVDEERSLADLREAYWAYEADDYELLVGVNTVFWGVTESVHLVDIVNQTDAVGDIDGEDKLGQPMVNLEWQRDWGLVSAYLLPYFRERTFAGVDGRLRTPVPVDDELAEFESDAGANHLDLALRYSHYIDDFDFGLSIFRGTSREPRLLPNASDSSLIPVYDQIDQVGLDLQYTGEAWLWKLEAIARDSANDSWNATVGGFEYTVYQVADSAIDIGWLVEAQYDGRADSEPLTLADNDLFFGIRIAANDIQDSTLLAGTAYDLDSGETYVNIEAERRFGDAYLVELKARFFTNAKPGDTSYAIERDDYLQLQLSHYF